MNESRTTDDPAVTRPPATRIPVRSISLAIVVAVVLYVGMVTLADWEAFGAAVSALPAVLWVQVVLLSCSVLCSGLRPGIALLLLWVTTFRSFVTSKSTSRRLL